MNLVGPTEWRITGEPWWLLQLLLPAAIAVAVPAAFFLLTNVTVTVVAGTMGAVAVARMAGLLRLRVRLTVDGVEVPQMRTKTYRWSAIESVELGPVWEGRAVWLRIRGDLPGTQPEVLPLPRQTFRNRHDEALQAAEAAIRARLQPYRPS